MSIGNDMMESVLEDSTQWCRVRISVNDSKSITKVHLMDKWCQGRFALDSYFRFGSSFFFMNAEDSTMFKIVWST